VDLRVALPADPQSAEVVQPRQGAPNHPAFATQAGAVIGAAAGDPVLEPAGAEFSTILVVVIAAVGDHALGPLPRPAWFAGDRAMPSTSGNSCVTSLRLPPVSVTASGTPAASTWR